VDGSLVWPPRGTLGFGYDPIFQARRRPARPMAKSIPRRNTPPATARGPWRSWWRRVSSAGTPRNDADRPVRFALRAPRRRGVAALRFADANQIAGYNPLLRVPVLVLDSGETLIDSSAILDHLDETVGEDRAMLPASGPRRRAALRICAFATGLAEKAVSLVYEEHMHALPSDDIVARIRRQMTSALHLLETDRQARQTTYWFGGDIGHADIAVACALRFLAEAHPVFFELEKFPALAAHSALCQAMAAFAQSSQAFRGPGT
jgi:glutathione S-transferase